MRKNLSRIISPLLVLVLMLSSCQKETTEPSPYVAPEEESSSENLANKFGKNACRLVYFDWPTVGTQQFYYNDKGLADLWTLDYGFGAPLHTNAITYDKYKRLFKSNEVYFGSNYEYRFYYTGKRLTRVTRINVDIPEDAMDFTYTYNWKGQNIRQDDVVTDAHVLMEYDAFGNCTRTDIYFGSDLYYSDNYTFYKPVRNPRLNIPGIETGFAFYGTGGFTDRLFFTSNKTIIYENGVPILFNDYDPSQTTIKRGKNFLPNAASYFDRITETAVNVAFDYDNCWGESGWEHSQGNKPIQNNKTAGFTKPRLTMGSLKSIKEQIDNLRKQFKSGQLK